jgi:hypothetical protein
MTATKLPAAHLGGTPGQRRRANEVVAMTLGIYALSTPRDDPGALFGFECALLAIIQGDRAAAMERAGDDYDREVSEGAQ